MWDCKKKKVFRQATVIVFCVFITDQYPQWHDIAALVTLSDADVGNTPWLNTHVHLCTEFRSFTQKQGHLGVMDTTFLSLFSPPVLPLTDNLDAVCNVCCSRWLKLNEWYNQSCWDYRGRNWCYLSNDVLFCGSKATNRKEREMAAADAVYDFTL